MKKRNIFISLLISISVVFVFAFQPSDDLKTLYEKAKYTMETKGDLQEALNIFEQIVGNANADRSLRAKAQLHIGMCKEKLGLKEAINAYQEVVNSYPEQHGEVAVAKERIMVLSKALEKVDHKPNFRKILMPTKPGNGVLSPDGKKLAYVSEGSLWIVPVHGKVSPDIAGESVKLLGTENAWHFGMSWSADGKWIAYNTWKNDTMGICIVHSSGGKVKRISVNKNRTGIGWFNYRLSLSPDGKIVAFAIEEKEKIQLCPVYVEGGDVNQLTVDGGTQPAFSPDGIKIAYVKAKPQKTEIPKSDVWVIPAGGGNPVQVSDLPGRATGPIWSSDGKKIAFSRKAGGDAMSKEICIVPVSETGKPEASPTQMEIPLDLKHLPHKWRFPLKRMTF
jgi:dipeptidyl aminopeptidase/acylaminoacyl peptidase